MHELFLTTHGVRFFLLHDTILTTFAGYHFRPRYTRGGQ
jgi:hypothetical protein